MKTHPSPDNLRSRLVYDPDTGALTWNAINPDPKNWNKQHAGKPAFTTEIRGYLCGAVNRVLLRAHRVAWAIHYGNWPEVEIDHINGNKKDNRLLNLRDVSASENRRNQKMNTRNQSGKTGVCFIQSRNKWRALISHAGQRVDLGSFDDRASAVAAREMAEAQFGYHENHGRQS